MPQIEKELTKQKAKNTTPMLSLGRAAYYGSGSSIAKTKRNTMHARYNGQEKTVSDYESSNANGTNETKNEKPQKFVSDAQIMSTSASQPMVSKSSQRQPSIDLGSMPIIDESCEFLLKSMKGVVALQDPEVRGVNIDQASSLTMLTRSINDLLKTKCEVAMTYIEMQKLQREVVDVTPTEE